MKLKFIVLGFIVILSTSCEYLSYYNFEVSNQTQDTILVYIEPSHHSTDHQPIYKRIPPNSTFLIYRHEGPFIQKNDFPPAMSSFFASIDSIRIAKKDTIYTRYNYYKDSLWTYSQSVRLGLYSAEINEDDF